MNRPHVPYGNHKQMIETPLAWPNWPVLTLKRGSRNDELGLITPDYPSSVIMLNLFQVDKNQLVIHQLANDGNVNGVEVKKYESVDAMLADGWIVD